MSKLDRRKARTLRKLRTACIDLALEIGCHRITARGLARRAGISSSTFYRHFPDKDALVMHIIQDMIAGMQAELAKAQSPREEAERKYRYIQRHPRLFRMYLSLRRDDPARQMVKQAFMEIVRKRYRPQLETKVEPDLAMNHVLASSDELLAWYLDHIDAYSSEEIAAIYCQLVVRATAELALEPRQDWLQRFPIPAPDRSPGAG